MERDDELKNLRAHLDRLEMELIEAKKRLIALENAPESHPQPVDVPAPAPPPLAAAPVPPPLPTQAQKPAAAPPPLPWERPQPATAVQSTVPTGEASGETAATEENVAVVAAGVPPALPAPKPSPWKTSQPKKPRRFGPPEGMDFETALGTWWLPRIGIVILSIGIVFLLTWAGNTLFSGWLRPYLQVAGGYAVCAGLLIAAKRLEASARNYARVLASGGFALSYFTTFAAHFVVSPPVLASQALTGLLLFAVVIAWGVIAQRRKSPLLGLGVTLLGHFTIFLALKAADTSGAFSLVSLLLFSLMSAFFLVKNRWYAVGAAGMVCSYLNLAVLLDNQVFVAQSMSTPSAVLLLALVYAVFALAELFAPEELRRRDVRLSLRAAFVSANTLLAVGLALLLWNTRGLAGLPGVHVLYGGAGLVVLALARAYWHTRRGDPLYNIYQIKGLSLLTLALGKYLSGEQLAVTLAVEALVLLLNAAATGFVVSRVFSWACALLSAGAMAQALARIGPAIGLAENRGAYISMWLVFALLHVAGVAYLRVDWRQRGLALDTVAPRFRALLQGLDLTDAPAASGLAVIPLRPADVRAIWPLYFSILAFVPWLFWLFTGHAGQAQWAGEALAAVSLLVLALAGVALCAWNLTLPLFFAACALAAAMYGLGRPAIPESQIIYPRMIGVVALALLLLTETVRLGAVRAPEAWFLPFKAPRRLSHAFALLSAIFLFHTVTEFFAPERLASVCAVVALAFAVYTAVTGAVFWQTAVLFQGIAAFGAVIRMIDQEAPMGFDQWALFAAMAATALFAHVAQLPDLPGLTRFRHLPVALWLALMFWAVLFMEAWVPRGQVPPLAFPALAAAGLGLALLFDLRVFAPWPVLTIALGGLLLYADGEVPRDTIWTTGACALVVLSIATERVFRANGVWQRARLHDISVLSGGLLTCAVVDNYLSGPREVAAHFAVGAAFLAYAAQGRLYLTAAAILLLAGIGTALSASGELVSLSVYPLLGPLATTGAAVVFWALVEWGLRTRGTTKNQREIAGLLALLVCGLLLRTLHQIDALANFYLTVAWTLAAVAMMAAGALAGQAFYRYGALATFGIVILRAGLWDTRNLDLVARVISFMLLGIVLLVVAYGYVRARGNTRPAAPAPPQSPKPGPPPLPPAAE